MSDKPVKKTAAPKIAPRAATPVEVAPAVVASSPAPAVEPLPTPVKVVPPHPSQAVVNDEGKKDFREQIKDGERNEATGEPIDKIAVSVSAAEQTILAEARDAVIANFTRIWGHLGQDNPPELFPLLTIEDTVLSRNMVTGGYTVMGPKNGRQDFVEGEEFDMLECLRVNAQMSSHNAELRKRQVGLARRLIP